MPSINNNKKQSQEEKKSSFLDEEERNIDVTPDEKLWGALSYITFFFIPIITLIVKKDSEFCKFHAKQGLILALIFAVLRMSWMLWYAVPFLGLVELGIIVFAGIRAYTGRWWKIPFIHDLSQKLPF